MHGTQSAPIDGAQQGPLPDAGPPLAAHARGRHGPPGHYRRLSWHRLEEIFHDVRYFGDMSTQMMMERSQDIARPNVVAARSFLHIAFCRTRFK